ncbi:hypothetical protein OHC33_009040 [Knufia fluminis]|uniref:RED-like N-terminal domain-containing protein n=1 Tax=Knufia fluminis TaxID=191047 RepID=A0AAN8EB80_9EURO|nr:hypothetical protein OHC33_009040 [Knufia fluminis]
MPSDQNGFKKPMALGSKARSFIPMTPRSLKPNHDSRSDFAKQVADHTGRGQDGQPPQKKFRSNAAPKGTKFASGYTDRAKERLKEQEDAGEGIQQRLKALEKMVKDEEIDQETFEKLRDELGVGGDTSSTHLVKGLDFKLLERVRRGEDVTKAPATAVTEEPPNAEEDVNVEDELEKALEKDVAVSAQNKPSEPLGEDIAGTETLAHTATLSRNEILRRLKENRKNPGLSSAEVVPQEPQPSLDHSKFRKLESAKKPNKHKFTETINGRRREVLVITGKDGQTKRKTRWLDPEPDPSTAKKSEEQPWGGDLSDELLARQKAAAEQATKQDDDEEDDDIFGGVTDYDPLAGLNSDEDEEAGDKEPISKAEEEPVKEAPLEEAESQIGAAKPLKSTAQPRNYFVTGTNDSVEEASKAPAHDPTILAAIKRAAQIRKQEEAEGAEAVPEADTDVTNRPAESSERSKALLKKLQQQSGQDDMDLDMGFGGDTRYDDDEGDTKQKLSEWRGVGAYGEDDEEEAGKKGGDAKRKRGGKKRKGDKNSYTDVMNVIEGRKKG